MRNGAAVICAICERSLLLGERAVRFSPNGADFVEVCPLCQEIALEHGWIREGSPLLPTVAAERRRRRGWLDSLFGGGGGGSRRPSVQPSVAEPILRRLSQPEQAVVEAADLFNASDFRRTIEGIARSLGSPRVSVVPLSGVNSEVVITVAWDISWYQYRIAPESVQPVRVAERGLDPEELDSPFSDWNAEFTEDGRIVPEIARAQV
jgi:hypothetical protein